VKRTLLGFNVPTPVSAAQVDVVLRLGVAGEATQFHPFESKHGGWSGACFIAKIKSFLRMGV
jgi:hypothetical protein